MQPTTLIGIPSSNSNMTITLHGYYEIDTARTLEHALSYSCYKGLSIFIFRMYDN